MEEERTDLFAGSQSGSGSGSGLEEERKKEEIGKEEDNGSSERNKTPSLLKIVSRFCTTHSLYLPSPSYSLFSGTKGV